MVGWCTVTDFDDELARARAAADRQLAHVTDALNDVVLKQARELLTGEDATDVWARLSTQIAAQLDCTSPRQKFAAELLAAAAIKLVQEP